MYGYKSYSDSTMCFCSQVLINSLINCVNFASTKVSKMSPRTVLYLKNALFSAFIPHTTNFKHIFNETITKKMYCSRQYLTKPMIKYIFFEYPRILKNTDKIIKKNNLLQVINFIHDFGIISFFTDHSVSE
jgi:hypothetical protein